MFETALSVIAGVVIVAIGIAALVGVIRDPNLGPDGVRFLGILSFGIIMVGMIFLDPVLQLIFK